MSKKPKRTKQKTGLASRTALIDKWLSQASNQVFQKEYAGAVDTCQRLLNYLPQKARQRAEALYYLATAQSMLQNFPQAYEAYTEALSLTPEDAQLWYNRGLACRFTARMGQSFRDFERAVELNNNPAFTRQFAKELKFSHNLAEKTRKMREPNFTLDQLIEQEGLYQSALDLMQAGKWEEAGKVFQRVIEMGDCLPQPWGNLGTCFIMQERYDEGEAALKRALEIDRRYAPAKQNLALLPETRRKGPPKMVGMLDPFRGAKIKQEITFVVEE